MRRLAAHLALAALYIGFLSPLVVAQESTLHACCLRNGAHHCQGTSSDQDGFHAKQTTCPYAAQLSPVAPFGLEPAKLTFGSPATVRLLVLNSSAWHSLIAISDLSARAPPTLL